MSSKFKEVLDENDQCTSFRQICYKTAMLEGSGCPKQAISQGVSQNTYQIHTKTLKKHHSEGSQSIQRRLNTAFFKVGVGEAKHYDAYTMCDYILLNSAPALALAKPSQAKQRLRWHYIHSETADPATGHWARGTNSSSTHFPLKTLCFIHFWKPWTKSSSMIMTPAIMIPIRKVRMIRNVLQVQRSS